LPLVDANQVDTRTEIDHVEKAAEPILPEGRVIKSPFEDLSFWRTMRVYRKAVLFAICAAFSAAAE
jgi:SP family general alpha glucoside:H+ symporter-like MFS transporter